MIDQSFETLSTKAKKHIHKSLSGISPEQRAEALPALSRAVRAVEWVNGALSPDLYQALSIAKRDISFDRNWFLRYFVPGQGYCGNLEITRYKFGLCYLHSVQGVHPDAIWEVVDPINPEFLSEAEKDNRNLVRYLATFTPELIERRLISGLE